MTETKPPLWKVILNLIYAALAAAKQGGLFHKKPGPDIK